MQTEIHLFIIWSKAIDKKYKIIKNIKNKFNILKIYNISWSKEKFSENLSRFYGENLPKNSGKEKHCGNGMFTCVIVKDKNPIYKTKLTSKGYRVVNINLFDAKQLYREWTGGGHKIHATDNIDEAKLQLLLLFGKKYSDFLSEDIVLEEITYKNDLIGANGWNSFEELFDVLNNSSKYIILRNFDNLDEQLCSRHPDVDLLVENKNLVANILNAKPTTGKKYRVQYSIIVNNRKINFDLRYIGDRYYDDKFQYNLLNTRIKYKYFYVPNNELLLYSLIYHALIHKNFISPDYIDMFVELFKKLNIKHNMSIFIDNNLLEFLLIYMNEHRYEIVEPHDLTVGFNTSLIYQRIFIEKSFKRKINDKYVNLKLKIKFLIKKILKKLNIK